MDGKVRRAVRLTVAVGALLALGATAAVAGGAVHQASGVYQFDDMSHAGEASLTRTGATVSLRLSTAVSGQLTDFGEILDPAWEAGDATTVWFVVFNDPAGCVGPCGEDDVLDALFGSNRAAVGLHYGAGHVAGGDRFRAAASLREWDTSGRVFGMPLWDSMTAEIHVVVRSHGPSSTLSGHELSEAIHTLDGGCTTNTCGDPQFAVFLAP